MLHQPYMTAMSHLSDAQELMSSGNVKEANRRINFSKWIIVRYKNDMVSEFNADKEWDEFVKKGF